MAKKSFDPEGKTLFGPYMLFLVKKSELCLLSVFNILKLRCGLNLKRNLGGRGSRNAISVHIKQIYVHLFLPEKNHMLDKMGPSMST